MGVWRYPVRRKRWNEDACLTWVCSRNLRDVALVADSNLKNPINVFLVKFVQEEGHRASFNQDKVSRHLKASTQLFLNAVQAGILRPRNNLYLASEVLRAFPPRRPGRPASPVDSYSISCLVQIYLTEPRVKNQNKFREKYDFSQWTSRYLKELPTVLELGRRSSKGSDENTIRNRISFLNRSAFRLAEEEIRFCEKRGLRTVEELQHMRDCLATWRSKGKPRDVVSIP